MTAVAGVFGSPIKQSKSPIIHHHFAQQFALPLHYGKQLSEPETFEADLARFFSGTNVVGANVTMPFKEQAFAWVDELSVQAARSGAVNTIINNKEEGKFVGANTDGLGLIADLRFHEVDLRGKRLLLIGAGGAAKGAISALVDSGIHSAAVYNRSIDRAESLIEQTTVFADCDLSLLTNDCKAFDVVINATSLSLTNQVPSVPNSIVGPSTVIYDMVYSDEPTTFMQWGEQLGCAKTIDGLGMLVEQAALSFEYWFDKKPSTVDIREQLRKG
jgi:shikimate dehydrogenase